jgi:hypothetical protein
MLILTDRTSPLVSPDTDGGLDEAEVDINPQETPPNAVLIFGGNDGICKRK